MKRKLTSYTLALAVMASMSLPAFAADCRISRGTCPANMLLRQMLCQYGGTCDSSNSCEATDVNELLNRLLEQYHVTLPKAPFEKPVEPEPSDEPEIPAEIPAHPENPAEAELPTELEQNGEQTSVGANAYEREVIRLVNVERAKYGLSALSEDAALIRTARMKSQDMHDSRYFDHNSPTYGTPFQLMKSQGIIYRTAGENIAMGYATPEAVVSAWMNSSGHRANILNSSYTKIGVGFVESGYYWTQHFTG